MTKESPEEILKNVLEKAENNKNTSFVSNPETRKRLEYICRCPSNRACARLLMSCLLAKIERPGIDPRNPYTEIGSDNSFSGRTYDEKYLSQFISKNRLPCNATTAFLTPTLRNINRPLLTSVELIGRPRELYQETLILLDDLANNKEESELIFCEAVRLLLNFRDEKLTRISSLLNEIKCGEGSLPLSVEGIVKLIEQHLSCKNASRIPVLIVAAAYKAAGEKLGEKFLPLNSHNAADFQTGSIGDIEICLEDNNVVTAYEMKMKKVSVNDIDLAISKIARSKIKLQNYIFITTEHIEDPVLEYAKQLYEKTGGIEIAVLDCLSFLRHFLHLFSRLRMDFLDNYQELVLTEPDSSISQTLKEAFLILRQAAESGE